ncbi:uncharacterized protein SPAPADRAFT_136413 [Spathaspora passalidarum NRRL Y-27907]|uniref:Mitochondrial group I intron splicing factor CCM1 n=1 Tax=Spathaspora passalidarum (strain NRRL Y-27907 / 11-Y1) TaxID=619300 RepID=G3AM73_SPAPN|nr:uncharacterized protein SPAPADRAFT_136413 [Spathaspora passalidarum NRRL Y-27907]EGW32778.1 hypothetical protein SPAPADRAFT_136413 [Spathaspora passalidarum NRRL Y-27907]
MKRDGVNSTLSVEITIDVFEQCSDVVLRKCRESNHRVAIPKFLQRLISTLMKDVPNLPTSTMVRLVDLGSKIDNFKLAWQSLVYRLGEQIPTDLSCAMIDYYAQRSVPLLETFEEIALLGEIRPILLNDGVIERVNLYIEALFKDTPPVTHCYENLEYHMDRIQMMVNNLAKGLQFELVTIESVIKLLKLVSELASVNEQEQSLVHVERVLKYLSEDKLDKVNEVIFHESVDDESLVETLLFNSWSLSYNTLARSITKFVLTNPVKFSPILQFQAQVYSQLSDSQSEETCVEKVSELLDLFEEDIDFVECYTRIIQTSMAFNISPNGEFIRLLTTHFHNNYHTQPSIESFKYRIDKAIKIKDHVQAINIFEDSLENNSWTEHISDPTIFKTLNDLIVLICSQMEDVYMVFPIFQKIKAQLQTQVNIDAINAMVTKMIQAKLIGDALELLSRELPKIAKTSETRIALVQPYAYKYRQLFNKFHNYVINHNDDGTSLDMNWFVYIRLHDYFYVPYECILPTMKFFCENERLNAALVIFRKTNELHKQLQHAPPSHEMYRYLFSQFGNNLYEQGVHELHECLKMDTAFVNPHDNLLDNTILNAYANLQDTNRCRRLFLSMSAKPKELGGVNEESAVIMIKAYTYSDLSYVESFFNNLSSFGIVPDKDIFKQYLIAHVYHGRADLAIEQADAVHDYDLEIDGDMLVGMYNYCVGKEGQKLIETWAEEKYPSEWNKVKSLCVESDGYEKEITSGIASDKQISD